jgi:hypothetical protein
VIDPFADPSVLLTFFPTDSRMTSMQKAQTPMSEGVQEVLDGLGHGEVRIPRMHMSLVGREFD